MSSAQSTLKPSASNEAKNLRVLVVDDNEAIHQDFRKILAVDKADIEFDAEEARIFSKPARMAPRSHFDLDFAFQGQQALELVKNAVAADRRYAVAFMDVRMPPGWDGLETTLKLWEVDPDLQIVICTAYSDYSWDEMMEMIAAPERVLILKKPFDTIEVLQLAHALTEKWMLLQASRQNAEKLEQAVEMRTRELENANAKLAAETADHKAAAERVREQALLIEQARDAIIVRAMDDTVLFWNSGAERLYGWTAAEMAGRKIADFLREDANADGDAGQARRAVVENGEWMGELSQKTRDGRIVDVECRWTLMRNGDGQPKSILAIDTDITERKKIESQFLRAQRLESIGTLAGGIAHDLNNILSPILMACGTLQPTSERDKLMLEALGASARRGADLVKQVLSFARGVEGKRIELDVKHLLAEIKKIIGATFPRNIEIQADFASELWPVTGDPTQLYQVLMNLCVNARDAMPDGGRLRLEVANLKTNGRFASMHPHPSGRDYVLIRVADTGTGIPPGIKDKIFDPFFTTKEVGKGTGLGLSTVLGIVKNHGGLIDLESTPGKGTAFDIYLPVSAGASLEPGEEEEKPLPPGHREWVLVVDDEQAILTIAQQTLELFGYRVLTARDGIEAVVQFMQHRDDVAVVLTDIMMPLMAGIPTIQALREIKPDVQIIAASGLTANADASAGCGVKHFLQKPYTVESLLNTLRKVLDSER